MNVSIQLSHLEKVINSVINKEFRKKPLIVAKFTSKGRKAMHEHATCNSEIFKTSNESIT
ncbi:hypothetical protein AT05_09990 [Schleiferia thermophila str. Yellowstone]|jgi:hypothetical protein|uniref:Uncharacterized protein n=1 Tax=Schleiferia thermophila TaxID=884107 RepID=A0A369A1M7_9FLAO|nr:hypothetical protein AT05_09990 [Schleiferia thermophila str. Yellowstone]PMB35298.1 hypothetical protein CEN47_09205 [Fischerella thermalis CCMEE 5319]RCX02256.1 hypothetical protein DES35_10415 [Schleiferia thermophila]